MAASYDPKGTHRTIQVSSTGSIDVQEIDARTKPHGIDFTRAVPYSVWQANGEGELLAPVAEAIEGWLNQDFIGGAVYVQQPGTDALLANAIEFTVWLPENHAFSTTETVSVDLLAGTDTFVTQIVAQTFQDALAHLQATAAL